MKSLILFMNICAMFCCVCVIGENERLTYNVPIELNIISAKVSASGINIKYKLVNKGKSPLYIIIPDPDASIDNWPKLPFVRYKESGNILELSSYIADLPVDRLIEAPYFHPVLKLKPGELVRYLSLNAPIMNNTPYGIDTSNKINLKSIKHIYLRLAYINCSQVELIMQKVNGKFGYKYVSAIAAINCDDQLKNVSELQSYVEDHYEILKERR